MTAQEKINEIQAAIKDARNTLTGMGESGIFGRLRAETESFIEDCERAISKLEKELGR